MLIPFASTTQRMVTQISRKARNDAGTPLCEKHHIVTTGPQVVALLVAKPPPEWSRAMALTGVVVSMVFKTRKDEARLSTSLLASAAKEH